MGPVGRTLRHPVLVRLCGLAVGALLLVAALAKLGELEGFARQLHNFHLAPLGAENLLAMTLPWIELVAGLSLLLGVRPRSGAWVAAGFMVVFTVAVGLAMARGLNIECGCFGSADATRIGWSKLGQNLVFTAGALIASLRPR
jgi:uncharacterized membrane protein YphA (DoxX/SURF4 family)